MERGSWKLSHRGLESKLLNHEFPPTKSQVQNHEKGLVEI
jgi:hypothetical protein